MEETTSTLVVKALISGHVCAFVSAFLNPLDVTKIRLQNQTASSSGLKYTGMVSGALCILREEGLAGWAKGLNASMMREVTYSTVRMGAYEPIRAVLSSLLDKDTRSISSDGKKHGNTHMSPLVKYSAALISGGVGSAICNPLDLVKVRLQASMPGDKQLYNSVYEALSIIHRSEGYAGWYKGWAVTCSRAAILNSAQLGSYDTIKNNIMIGTFGFHEGFFLHLCASMASGLITTTACNPVDVIKTRYMSDAQGLYRTPLHCITATYREAGVIGFFKGWMPSYWRLGPHTVFSLLLIEQIRGYMGFKPI